MDPKYCVCDRLFIPVDQTQWWCGKCKLSIECEPGTQDEAANEAILERNEREMQKEFAQREEPQDSVGDRQIAFALSLATKKETKSKQENWKRQLEAVRNESYELRKRMKQNEEQIDAILLQLSSELSSE